MISFERISPGGQLSAEQYNRLLDEVERLGRISGTPPIDVDRNDTGVQISLAHAFPFWAKLTGHLARDGSGSGSGGSGSGDSGSGESGAASRPPDEPSGDPGDDSTTTDPATASGSGGSGSGSGSGSGNTGCRYSWKEQTSSLAECGLVDMTNGRTGYVDDLPAVPVTGQSDLPVGTPVLLHMADSGDHYLFAVGVGSLGRRQIDILTNACFIRGSISGSGTSGDDTTRA